MSLICSASRHRHIRSESWSSDTTDNIFDGVIYCNIDV